MIQHSKTVRDRIFIILVVCAALALGALYLYFSSENGAGIPCVTYMVTGFYCAGCGASRALRCLLHLQLYQAFRYNPLLVLVLPFAGVYFVAVAISYIKTGENRVDGKLSFRWLFVLALVVIGYSIIRNIPFFPFTWLQPTVITQ